MLEDGHLLEDDDDIYNHDLPIQNFSETVAIIAQKRKMSALLELAAMEGSHCVVPIANAASWLPMLIMLTFSSFGQ